MELVVLEALLLHIAIVGDEPVLLSGRLVGRHFLVGDPVLLGAAFVLELDGLGLLGERFLPLDWVEVLQDCIKIQFGIALGALAGGNRVRGSQVLGVEGGVLGVEVAVRGGLKEGSLLLVFFMLAELMFLLGVEKVVNKLVVVSVSVCEVLVELQFLG